MSSGDGGRRLFGPGSKKRLELAESRALATGVLILIYRRGVVANGARGWS